MVLTKAAPSVSLTKSGGAGGVLRVNLNWNARPAGGGGFFKKTQQLDLDLGCLWEFTDGTKGVVQALGNAFTAQPFGMSEPIISLDGDDRSGAVTRRREPVGEPRPSAEDPAHPRLRPHLRGRGELGRGATASRRCTRQHAGRTPTTSRLPRPARSPSPAGWADATGDSTGVTDQSTRSISSVQIGEAVDREVYGGFVDLRSEDPAPETALEPVALPDLDNGPHFFYGLQWWFFGVLAVFGFGYLAWDEWRKAREPAASRRRPEASRR